LVTPGSADEINVASSSLSGNPVLSFTGGFYAPSGQYGDDIFGYKVRALGGNTISGISLSSNPSVFGNAAAAITETAYLPNSITVIGQTAVTAPPGPQNGSISFANPLSEVVVKKDVYLNGGNSGGAAYISIVDQTLTPDPTAVPEPSSVLGTLAFGALGLGYMLKRQLKQNKPVGEVANS